MQNPPRMHCSAMHQSHASITAEYELHYKRVKSAQFFRHKRVRLLRLDSGQRDVAMLPEPDERIARPLNGSMDEWASSWTCTAMYEVHISFCRHMNIGQTNHAERTRCFLLVGPLSSRRCAIYQVYGSMVPYCPLRLASSSS